MCTGERRGIWSLASNLLDVYLKIYEATSQWRSFSSFFFSPPISYEVARDIQDYLP